jgi:hypothetical protein
MKGLTTHTVVNLGMCDFDSVDAKTFGRDRGGLWGKKFIKPKNLRMIGQTCLLRVIYFHLVGIAVLIISISL